jgi:hypothetical protein
MKTIRTVFAAAILVPATATFLGTALADDSSIAGAQVGKIASNLRPTFLSVPDPGYIVYSGYAGALPGPSCYWTRIPIYDSDRNVIGWRGRPVAVCP